jgi:hypothetical protein
MTKKFSVAAAALTLALTATTAAAANTTGYVCNIVLQPAAFSQPNGIGTEGDLLVILNSQADCGGTQVAYVYMFSVGATYPGASAAYLYTAAELQATYQALVVSRNKPTQRPVGLAYTGIQALQINLQ